MAINIKPEHKGDFHAYTGTPEGQKIPLSKIMAAKHSKSARVRKMATFAKNARAWGNAR